MPPRPSPDDDGSLERLLGEQGERNRDNVARTESYLELYTLARGRGIELPWVLMAHLVSRNAGYLMTDLADTRGDSARVFTREAMEQLLLFLERANFLIFHDAWHHLLHYLFLRVGALDDRTPRFMREAWRRYEDAKGGAAAVAPEIERALVLDLVKNEQNLIERRVVQSPRFAQARAMIGFFEAVGSDRPIVLPLTRAAIRVEGFAQLERRIETGRRIFDDVLAPRAEREAIYAWARAHPHTGSRGVYGGSERAGRTLREAWPVERVRALWPGVHDEPERDESWP